MDKSKFTTFIDDAGGILINKKTKQIALVHSKHGTWGFPKGKVDKGESYEQAARRELYEETGIKEFEMIRQMPTYERPNSGNPNILITMYMYLFHTDETNLQPTENQDIIEAKWVKKSDVVTNLTLSKDKEYFKKIQNEI